MLDEIADTLDQLRVRLESLAIRGIRATEPGDFALLQAAGEEFERIGAAHMAERIAEVVSAMRNNDETAASALLRAQTSLRLFERVLTLEVAQAALSSLGENASAEQEADT